MGEGTVSRQPQVIEINHYAKTSSSNPPHILTSRLHSFWACQFPRSYNGDVSSFRTDSTNSGRPNRTPEASGGNLHETTICFHRERPEAVDYSLAIPQNEHRTVKRIFSAIAMPHSIVTKLWLAGAMVVVPGVEPVEMACRSSFCFPDTKLALRGPHLPISISSHPLPDILLMPAPPPIMSICARLQFSWLPG